MKKIATILALAAAVCLVGCNDDIDDLQREVDELKSRVTALETQVAVLNSNVEAVQALAQQGATITKVEQAEDGTYTITLSNGEVVTLKQGSEAEAVVPVVAVDAEGYWVVDYRDGAGFVRIVVEGEPVKAVAADGITPCFRVDGEGLWEVSYDGGASYEKVLDTHGQPVSAIGSGEVTDKFFSEVKVEDDCLKITLLTGEQIAVPILPDFYCRIVATEGVQKFTPTQAVDFNVEIRGVEHVFLSAPDGWKTQLSEIVEDKAILTVTAPEAVRALADNTKDVTILATAGYYAIIAKIQVELEGGVVVVPPTVIGVTEVASTATESSLTFAVEVSEDADAWRWLCQEASLEAPNASAVAITGQLGEGTEVTVTGLNPETQYVLYVIAVKNPSVYSEVANAVATTTARIDTNDYYTAGVTIDGVTYSKESDGAQLLKLAADATEATAFAPSVGGVLFLEDESDSFDFVQSSSQALVKDVVVIGRYADHKIPVTIEKYSALRNRDGKIIFKNLKINTTAITNYVFNCGSASQEGGVGTLIFEDCEIDYQKIFITFNNSAADAFVGNLIFRNCKIRYDGTATSHTFMISQSHVTALDKFQQILFENNILYAKNTDVCASSLYRQDNASSQNGPSNCKVVFNNNTVVDFISFGAGQGCAYFEMGMYGSLECKNNLFYSGQTDKYPSIMRCYTDYGEAWPSTDISSTASMSYGTKGWKLFFYGTEGSYYPAGTNTTFQKASSTPLSTVDKDNGTFVKAAEFAAYGSTLE